MILPVAGWIIGAVMVLASPRWSTRDKLVGLLVWPGGLAVALGLVVFAPIRQCVYVNDTAGHHHGGQCTGTALPGWLGLPLLAIAVIGPLITAVHLSRRARRA